MVARKTKIHLNASIHLLIQGHASRLRRVHLLRNPAAVAVLFCATTALAENRITHGPMLGRPTPTSVAVWIRSERPGPFVVHYGTDPDSLTERNTSGVTRIEHDNTGSVVLEGLKFDTRYHYRAVVGSDTDAGLGGSFRTLPGREDTVHPTTNPRGLFNFTFEFGCCNHQVARKRGKIDVPVFDTMLRTHGDLLHFAIQNGDWCYEEGRDTEVADWLASVGLSSKDAPRVVRTIPLLVGAWENYKIYLDRSDSLTKWHRNVPSHFLFDDHEILDDAAGAGQIGARPRRALYRDIGLRGWYDYLGWANPVDSDDLRFGIADFLAGSNVLVDQNADFSKLVPSESAELHVHWKGPTANKKQKEFDTANDGGPNAGVYEIIRVIDPHRLEIRPPTQGDDSASYSIGRVSYFKQRISNCDFFYLDTRSHGDLPEDGNPKKPGLSLLGTRQKAWLKREMQASQADCFFVVSTVNFMIPHVVDVGQTDFTNHIDSWPAFWHEREELLELFKATGKKVFVLTGDLHNSFAIQVTDNVWEFASAPHNSGNASYLSEGGRAPTGVFDSFGRECFIRWSTWFENKTAAKVVPRKNYCVVSVNNVFPGADEDGRRLWQAFPNPQVVFQYHDGVTGELLYAESILLGVVS